MKKLNKFFENFIFAAIILVVIQTFLDDYSRFAGWPVSLRNILLISGFVFDFIFTVEFIVRSLYGLKNREFRKYFWYNRGWVDFLSSIPLLLLNSGPSLYILLTGNVYSLAEGVGVLNVLKVIKAIRVTRILRLIRVIKIFGKIHNTDSKMAQHHTAVITTTAVFSIIFTLIMFSFINSEALNKADEKAEMYRLHLKSAVDLTENNYISHEDAARIIFKNDNSVVFLKYKQTDIIILDKKYFQKYYDYEDFRVIKMNDYEMYVSLKDINADIALHHIQNFAIIMILVLAFSFLYTRHFAQTVSDVAHILNLGLRKKDYMLQIKINKNYEDHEIFKLAKFYNDAYLPAKMKKNSAEKTAAAKNLSMKDLFNFNKK
ncbi:MAG: ion transporter [Spirochaetes bacterium]|nr:ion transporter [Spirochaetota bacterium]